jgi:hypothetical protein
MSASTVPAVKTKLVELCKAAVGESTEVWRSRPKEDHQEAENVYLGRTRGRRKFVTFPATAPKSRQEDYATMVEVEVSREGTDIEGAELRLWEIVAALEAALAAKPTLDDITSWSLVSDFDQETPTFTDGVIAKYVFAVEVTARI